MGEQVAEFSREANGRPVVSACLDLVAFSDTAGPEGAPGFSQLYEWVVARLGNEFRWYATNDMKSMKAVDEGTMEMVRFWFRDPGSMREEILGIRLVAGSDPRAPVAPGFQMLCVQEDDEPAHSFFRVELPVAPGPQAAEALLGLAGGLDGFPLSSGYAGYSIFWNDRDPQICKDAARHYAAWMLRHPGFSHGLPLELMRIAQTGVVNVGWLTILGEKYLGRLGGLDGLRVQLGEAVSVSSPNPTTAIIQAGPEPGIGDLDRGDSLSLYRRVAEVLKPVWIPEEESSEAWISGLESNQMESWLARFFE